jgi:glyoxylase-like metal-dependent hydrolase (beta-lactamase superfamily II)
MITNGDRALPPWCGGQINPMIHCVLAPNPGLMTLDGTNTWLLGDPASGQMIVVDPGPDDVRHVDAVVAALVGRGARVVAIVLTHGHEDHSGALAQLVQRTRAEVWQPERIGRIRRWAGLSLEVIRTPGHTSDSVSLLLPEQNALLTGDTVLGRGTAVIAHPDGRLDTYLESLETLRGRASTGELDLILPGHGPALAEPLKTIEAYQQHRKSRLDQVRAALTAGAVSADDVVAAVYADVDRALWPAARASVLAQLEYLGR